MKKLFLLVAGFALLGAGCMGGNSSVESPWTLGFDLPNNWSMYAPYTETNFPGGTITKEDAEVWLQSSEEAKTEETTWVSVAKLDSRRIIPSEAEQIEGDFYQVEECKNDMCSNVYYLKTDTFNYKFTLHLGDSSEEEVTAMIFTAQEVVEE